MEGTTIDEHEESDSIVEIGIPMEEQGVYGVPWGKQGVYGVLHVEVDKSGIWIWVGMMADAPASQIVRAVQSDDS